MGHAAQSHRVMAGLVPAISIPVAGAVLHEFEITGTHAFGVAR